jgi:hypothetical protein
VIAERIYNDWSYDRRGNKMDWNDNSIYVWLPSWLKDPRFAQGKLAASLNKFLKSVESQANQMVAMAEKFRFF